MSTQSRFFTGYNDQHIRVSDAERQSFTDRLAVHYGDGRLDQAEFDERIGRAMSAKTRGDLRGLLDDLPEPGPAGAPGVAAGVTAGPIAARRRTRHPVLLVALLVFLTLAFAHEVFWFVVPGMFLGIALIAVLALTGHLGRSRAR